MLAGDVPSPLAVPQGCRFAPRCPLAQARCLQEDPQPATLDDGRQVACHFAQAPSAN